MTDRHGKEADYDRRTARHSANDDAVQTISSVTHALSERLTATVHYFGATRAYLAKGDNKAAEQLIMRLLEQSDHARKLAEQLRALMKERLP